MKRYIITFILIFLSLNIVYTQEEEKNVESILKEIRKYESNSAIFQTHSLLAAQTDSSSYIGTIPNFSIGMGGALVLSDTILSPLLDNTLTLKGLSNISDISIGAVPGIVKLRIGGILLPFDMGLSMFNYGYIQPSSGTGFFLPISTYQRLQGNYIAADIRIPILRQRDRVPGWSIAVAYAYDTSRAESDVSEQDATYNDDDLAQAVQVNFSKGTIGLSNVLHTVSIKTQISKVYSFFEPYFGLEGYLSFGTTNFFYKGEIGVSAGGVEVPFDTLGQSVQIDGAKLTPNSFVDSRNYSNYNLRVYGGSALKFGIFYLELGGSYEIIHSSVAVSVGMRFQPEFNSYY